jgi:hypothetical protein
VQGTRQQRGVCPVCDHAVYSDQTRLNINGVYYHDQCYQADKALQEQESDNIRKLLEKALPPPPQQQQQQYAPPPPQQQQQYAPPPQQQQQQYAPWPQQQQQQYAPPPQQQQLYQQPVERQVFIVPQWAQQLRGVGIKFG